MSSSGASGGARNGMRKHSLIVLDDNPGWGNFVSDVAEKVGFCASYATSQAEFVDAAIAQPPDVVILDLFMPEKDGIEMIMDLAQWENRPFIVLISGQSNALLTSAGKLGRSKGLEVVGSLVKPFRLADLRALLHQTVGLVEKRKKTGPRIAVFSEGRGTPVPLTEPEPDRKARESGPCPVPDEDVGETNTLPVSTVPPPPEARSLKILKDHLTGNPTGDNVKRSIAAINARFCLALWQTHLAALTALNYVPTRLAEAAAALIASRNGSRQASGWRQAVRTNMRTLASGQALIREVANSLRLTEHGRSTIWSINRLNAIVSEIQVLKHTKSGSLGKLLSLYREICAENEELKRGLDVLLAGLSDAINRGEEGRGVIDPERQHRAAFGVEDVNMRLCGLQARNAGSGN